jgi:hypothetical protein
MKSRVIYLILSCPTTSLGFPLGCLTVLLRPTMIPSLQIIPQDQALPTPLVLVFLPSLSGSLRGWILPMTQPQRLRELSVLPCGDHRILKGRGCDRLSPRVALDARCRPIQPVIRTFGNDLMVAEDAGTATDSCHPTCSSAESAKPSPVGNAGKTQAEPSRWQKFKVPHETCFSEKVIRRHDLSFLLTWAEGDGGTWAAAKLF